jgi:transcriptional regulator GlxA family with amidase domain
MRIGLIVPPGFAVLSFAPLSVFEAANGVLGKPFYEVHAVSVPGGRIPNSFGMELVTERVTDGTFDTLLIGSPPELRPQSPELLSFLRSAPATTRRIASICIGAFILGDAGLLDGRRATTHWFYAGELQRRYPKATVDMDRIFIADGQIWTSAGMTAGIDLALGLVERDIGREATRELARMLVVHHRRAGGQSQHSALLDIDAISDRVQTALQFARSNLGTPLTVEKLAETARLSPRQFSRVFRSETGISPAKAIENLRLAAHARAEPPAHRKDRQRNRVRRPGAHAPQLHARLRSEPAIGTERVAPSGVILSPHRWRLFPVGLSSPRPK